MEKQVDCIGFDHETGKIGPLAQEAEIAATDCQNKEREKEKEREREREGESCNRMKRKNKRTDKRRAPKINDSTYSRHTYTRHLKTLLTLFYSFIHSHWQFSPKLNLLV